jgi:hypothetical protein
MRGSERVGLLASVVAVVVVAVLGTAFSITLHSFARGFVALGSISVIAVSAILWRPFASRLLEEGLWTARLTGAIDSAYRRQKRSGRRRTDRARFLVALVLVLLGWAVGVFLGFENWPDNPSLRSPVAADVAPPQGAAPDVAAQWRRKEHRSQPRAHQHRSASGRFHEPSMASPSHEQVWREPAETGASTVEADGPLSSFETRPRSREVERKTSRVTSSMSASGGSSPVVPILIAIVVLAAISIGVVLYRQRQSGDQASSTGARHRLRL